MLGVIVLFFMGSLLLGGVGVEWMYDMMVYYSPAFSLVSELPWSCSDLPAFVVVEFFLFLHHPAFWSEYLCRQIKTIPYIYKHDGVLPNYL